MTILRQKLKFQTEHIGMLGVDIQKRSQMHMRGFCWMRLKVRGGCLSEAMSWMQPGHSSLQFWRSWKEKKLYRNTILMEAVALLGLIILQRDTMFGGVILV